MGINRVVNWINADLNKVLHVSTEVIKHQIYGLYFHIFPFKAESWTVALPSWEDQPPAPPGNPLALPLIYSLIHLCCCHMASLSLHPPSVTPSIIPLSLPSSSHISGLLIVGASRSAHAPPFSPSSLLSCNRAPCLLRLRCSSLPRSAQIRSCHRQRLMHPWASH